MISHGFAPAAPRRRVDRIGEGERDLGSRRRALGLAHIARVIAPAARHREPELQLRLRVRVHSRLAASSASPVRRRLCRRRPVGVGRENVEQAPGGLRPTSSSLLEPIDGSMLFRSASTNRSLRRCALLCLRSRAARGTGVLVAGLEALDLRMRERRCASTPLGRTASRRVAAAAATWGPQAVGLALTRCSSCCASLKRRREADCHLRDRLRQHAAHLPRAKAGSILNTARSRSDIEDFGRTSMGGRPTEVHRCPKASYSKGSY